MTGPNSGITLDMVRAGTGVLKYDVQTTSSAVKTLQLMLNSKEYDCGTPDGKFGNVTTAAVQSFQRDTFLTDDGIIGKNSISKIDGIIAEGSSTPNSGVTLAMVRVGVKSLRVDTTVCNDAVKHVQRMLNSLGHNCGAPDGLYGNGTKAQVQAFQQKNSLITDGICGKLTLTKLETLTSGASNDPDVNAVELLRIARGEIGYQEGNDNDTKYGDWYGASNAEWCAMFVSWCANRAGNMDVNCAQSMGSGASRLRDGMIPKHALTSWGGDAVPNRRPLSASSQLQA